MSKIAIDVVLLPSEEMMDKAIEVNQKQLIKYKSEVRLNKQNCWPHISLAMGAINKKDLSTVSDILREIASRFKIFNLIADGYRSLIIPSGEIYSEYTVKNTKELQRLHETIIKKLKRFLTYDITIDMLYSSPAFDKTTLLFIKNYLKNSSYKNFEPHISLGVGKTENVATPIASTASTLALCHLGNYCTCRKILFSTNLSSPIAV